MIWIALYSQTGSELQTITERLGRDPDLVLTNNKQARFGLIYDHQTIEDTLMSIDDKCIITLHGYLRILSPRVCSKHYIINGHPGPIHLYPELKGKDPQVRWFENRDQYDVMGAVLHEVIPEVDEGRILSTFTSSYKPDNIDDVFKALKNMSFDMWCNLLREELR